MSGSGLNPEQQAAVAHGGGPLLILAGAGSGKTRVLTRRIVRLILEVGVAPYQILAMTFTNKAASVMRDRIAEALGSEPQGLWVGTFHSVAARILRREAMSSTRSSGFSIYDADDSLRVIRGAMEEVGLDTQRWSPQAIRGRISSAKNALVTAESYAETAFNLLSKAVASVYPVYERRLTAANAYDFDDLLMHTALLLEGNEEVGDRYARRFVHVMVDEYQDTNHAQYRIVRRLAAGHGNVCVVGDDDQSIYGWRGADLSNILDFERDYPGTEVVRLEQNYRSTASILEVANAVIVLNQSRKQKRLRTVRPAGEPVIVARLTDERAEANWVVEGIQTRRAVVSYGGCVILYRTNAQSRPLEDALRRARIPYRVVGGMRFYDRREIKDVLAYLQLAVNPADEAAFARAVSWPRRGVGSVTLVRLSSEATERGITLLEAAAQATQLSGLPVAGARALVDFAAGIAALRELSVRSTAEELLRECLRSFALVAALEAEQDGADRVANVTELLAAAAAFDPAEVDETMPDTTELALYLQAAALYTELDEIRDDADAVTLMTLHNAKGLEFPVVWIVGLEDGLFPLARAAESKEELEEERRLFYVGVTRAEDELLLCHAARRWRYGSESYSAPSPFLGELPDAFVSRLHVGAVGVRRAGSKQGPKRRQASWRAGASTDEPAGSSFSWHRSHTQGPAGEAGPCGGRKTRVSGITYDYEDSQVPLAIEPGVCVTHKMFGSGEIVAVSGAGTSMKADIEFERFGKKTLLVAHAGLRPA